MQHKFTLIAFLILFTGLLSGCSGGGSSCNDVVDPVISSNAPIGQNDTLRLSVYGVESGYTYSWTGSDGFTSREANPIIIHPAKGKNKTYIVEISTPGGCTYKDSINGIAVVGPWAPCGLDSNTAQLDGVTYMSLRTVKGSVTTSSTYKIEGVSTNAGVIVEFAGVSPPVEGVYTIQASSGTLATGYARATITTTTTGAWTPNSGSVYVSVEGSAVTVSFCNLAFTSTNGSSTGRINMTMP
ncbi:hypothetical protein SAMN05518672_101121 [Chitinophaga sp. CF118]|uniref:hypothetical protein n=1 Tax=Chitinophaga sp. CF118 TaxID=1884367 RepID=UPI0008E79950|nr:hypothetical protein [Chitinophaga sp. CF118]SFD03004.1 hypothetical protein SAMN05518672_101121 [Chitinophaga sp. CF118]